ncbi:uncharacterized protein LOC132748084, partial [Ruditapes philippinarum]|uniref:uncharacterized protein LOC132748084 n=1 Tax=Ruditapes philippinarum TaxID=129788 RepID=UPI00295BD1D4
GNKEKMPSLSSKKMRDGKKAQQKDHGEKKVYQADDSDEEVYDNEFEDSTGNPLEFTKGLVSVKKCNEGSILKLKCTVNKQDMKAMWYKDEKRLEQNERITQISKDLTHILEIQNVSQSDAGEYRVKIENLELTSKVTVKDVPLAFQQELVMEDSLKEGLNLNLRCSMNKLHTVPTWYKDGKPLEQNKRITQTSEGLSHILEIQNVYLQDSGVYTVKIESLSSTSKVTILEKPLAVTLSLQKTKKVEEGKDVQMKCIVSKPNQKAKWTFNGKVIKNMETRILVESSEMVHQLTIKNVTMDDAGEYCLEIEDLQEKTFLEVCDDTENEDIGGARGNSSPIFNSSSRPDEIGEYVRLKDTSHVNENATHDYVNIAGQDDTVGSNEQMAKQNSLTTSKSKTKFGHSLTLKETQRSSKTVSCGNEDGKFNDDSHSLTLNPSTGVCQLKKNRSAAVPASKNLLIPEKGHGLHTASVQTVQQSSSKIVKGKPMVNLCGKDQGDSSQSDDESNPHSSNEDPDVDELTASFKSRLKLNDSDADSAGSLPQTDDQQIAGQHGASGQADSEQLHVRVKFSGDTLRPVPLSFEKHMKYHYLLNHEKCFTNVANDLKKEKQIDISVKSGILHIYQGQKYERRYCIETVMDFIFRHTENIVVNGWPSLGVDIEKAEKELLSSKLGKLKEIYVRRYKGKMHVAYGSSLSMKVDQDVSKAFKKFLFANKGNISKTCDLPYILHRILKNTDWKKQFEDKYPNVQVEWEPDDDEDVVKVVFSGNKEKVLEAMKWFEKNIVGEYCCCSEEMKKIPELDLFSQPEDVVLEMFRGEIGEKRRKYCLRKTLLHDTGINQLIPDWNKSKYAVVQVDEDKIIVKGLEKYVQELKGTIEAMIKSKNKQNMSETDCFLECDRRFLNLIEEKGVLKDLSDKKQIQYRLVEKGIFYRGEVSNFSKFDDELKKMKKEYTTHYVDIHVSKEMDRTKVSEILHKTKENYDGHIKIDENKDTTPGNYQTATVLGPILKDDLQDCLYTRWCLKTCTVTLAEKLSDLSSADLVFVPVDENSKSDFSQSVKKIAVPIPKYKKMEGKTLIDQMEKYFDSKLSDEACISVCIKSSPINEWSRCKYVKPILYSLKQWAEKSKGPRKDIVLCCWDKDAFDCCFKYCHDAFKTKCETVKPINKDLYRDDFAVKVRKGGIVDFAVDVIVNTTRDDLKLNSGAVSSTILKSAGPELQNVVNKKRPNGINYGEILETEAFKLENAEVILHGALEEYNNDAKKLQKLEEFVHSCLVHADSRQYSSIALPAIGTGKLGYNESQVAATMFKAAKKFFRDHHPSALRCVMFIIYGKDIECLKAFEKEEKLWNQYLIWQSRAVVYEGVRVQPNQGSILDTTTDAVIYFWDDGVIHGSVTTRSNTVLAACGRDVFDTVSKKMRSKEANLILQKAENIKVDIFFMRCQNSPDEISKATREGLLKADKCKNITSICIGFDKSRMYT